MKTAEQLAQRQRPLAGISLWGVGAMKPGDGVLQALPLDVRHGVIGPAVRVLTEAGNRHYPILLPTNGQPRDLAGNNPLPLDDRGAAWLILAGQVDVFALPAARNSIAGAWSHLFRAAAGSWLLGVAPSSSPGATLLAVGQPCTQIAPVDLALLDELVRQPEGAALFGMALTAWVLGLTSGITRGPELGKMVILEPGREVRLRAGGVAASARDIVWVRLTRGCSRLLGMEELLLRPGACPFPLGGPGWLVSQEADTLLTTFATETVLSEGSWRAALDCFHAAVRRRATVNMMAEEAVQRARLEKRVSAEQRLTRTTLMRLAQAVTPEVPEAPSMEQEVDPVLAACRLVGASQGMDFQSPPPSAGVQRRGGDPVRAIARASRVRIRRVVLAGEWWRQDNGPLLAFRGQREQPVALLPLSASCYELVDPVSRQRTRISAEVAAELLPFAYCFYRSLASRPLRARHLIRFGVSSNWREGVQVVVLGLSAIRFK